MNIEVFGLQRKREVVKSAYDQKYALSTRKMVKVYFEIYQGSRGEAGWIVLGRCGDHDRMCPCKTCYLSQHLNRAERIPVTSLTRFASSNPRQSPFSITAVSTPESSTHSTISRMRPINAFSWGRMFRVRQCHCDSADARGYNTLDKF